MIFWNDPHLETTKVRKLLMHEESEYFNMGIELLYMMVQSLEELYSWVGIDQSIQNWGDLKKIFSAWPYGLDIAFWTLGQLAKYRVSWALDSQILTLTEKVLHLAEPIQYLTNLIQLELSNQELEVVPQELVALKKLKELDLVGNRLGVDKNKVQLTFERLGQLDNGF